MEPGRKVHVHHRAPLAGVGEQVWLSGQQKVIRTGVGRATLSASRSSAFRRFLWGRHIETVAFECLKHPRAHGLLSLREGRAELARTSEEDPSPKPAKLGQN